MADGELFINIDVGGNSKKVKDADKDMQNAEKSANKLDDATNKLNFDFSKLTGAIDKFKKSLNGIAKNINKDIENKAENAEKTKELTEQEEKHTKSVNKSNKETQQQNTNMALTIAKVVALAYAFKRLADSLFQTNQKWIDFGRTTDLNIGYLQKYDSVARAIGVEGTADAIADLQNKLFQTQLTGEGASGFLMAGINPMGKDVEQIMEELRQRVHGLNNTQATFILRQIGIDPKILPLLRLTNKEFEELNHRLDGYRLSESQLDSIQRGREELEIFSQKMQYLKDRVVIQLLPIFEKLANSILKITTKFVYFIEKSKILNAVAKNMNEILFGLSVIIGANLVKSVMSLGVALLNLVKLNPILATLSVGLMLLYKYNKQFKGFVNGFFEGGIGSQNITHNTSNSYSNMNNSNNSYNNITINSSQPANLINRQLRMSY